MKNRRLADTDVDHILPSISRIIADELNGCYKLFLFGSRATGRHHARSDIDLGIMSDGSMTAKQMQNVLEKLESLPTLLKIDLVDLNTVGDEFRKMALKNAMEIE